MPLSKTPVKSLSLYHYDACPYCAITRKTIQKLGLTIEYRNIQKHNQHRNDLIQGGGKKQVPCLRIEHANGETQWLYESNEIIHFISQ